MDLSKYWRIILAHRLPILLLAIVAAATALGLTYVLPEKYQSTAVLLVRPQEKIKFASDRSGKEVLDYPVSQLAPIDAPSKTYIAVIQSRAVIERIVLALGLHQKKRAVSENPYKEWLLQVKDQVLDALEWTENILKYGRGESESALSKAITKTTKNLSLKATKDTYVFEIMHEASDPAEAAAVANMAAEIFSEYMLAADGKDQAGVRELLEGRLRAGERELEAARLALRRYKEVQTTFSLDEEYKGQLKLINDLESELEKTNAKIAGLTQEYGPSYPKLVALAAEKEQALQTLNRLRGGLTPNPGKQSEVDKLALMVKVAEENYDAVVKAYKDASFAENKKVSEIRIVSRAVPASFPAKPIKYYYAGGGFMLALFIGIAWAIFREVQRARIRSIDDAVLALGLRVLATIPPIRRLARGRRS